jgi:hypothetical protein
MQVISDKDLSKKKKPVQVYFDAETVLYIQAKLGKSKVKMSMAEYIRVLVKKDLEPLKAQHKTRKWKTFDWGGEIPSDPREQDKIIYGI